MVKESQKLANQRKANEREVSLRKLKDARDMKQVLLDEDANHQMRTYGALEDEEARLLRSLEQTQQEQQKAYEQLEGVLGRGQQPGTAPPVAAQ